MSFADNYQLHKGDILFARTGASVGKTYMYSKLDGLVYFAGFLIRGRIKSEFNVEFIFQNTLTDTYNNFIHITSQRSGQPGVNAQEYAIFKLMVPTKEEQIKIGTFFNSLDILITLHQRKVNSLQRLKKALLQKMFPAKDKKIPELRFKGFLGDWEKRKLGEVVEFNPKSELPSEFEYIDLESVVGTDLISTRREKKGSAPSRAQRVAQNGDVFYQTVRPYQKNNYLFDMPETTETYVFSTGYAQMRPQIDSYFLFSQVQEERFVAKVLESSTGTSYPAINSNDLAKIKITVSIDKQEQIKIGKLFKNLDNLITLHQSKLNKLKSLKTAYLQLIFI